MKVAALQMVSGLDRDANLQAAKILLAQAAQQGAELAVLPEYFCLLGQRDTDKLDIQEVPGQGPIQDFLAHMARTLGLWIVGGTMPLATTSGLEVDVQTQAKRARVFNSSLVYSPHGECVARYDKMHLFRFDNGREHYDESRSLQSGTVPASFVLPSRDGHAWHIGLSVCYDLRFPELYRHYAQAGADLLLVPSAFTHTTGQAHWEVLLRARAIENLAFVLAAAQGGLHENARRTWGHSMVVDPWGGVLAQQASGADVVMAELDYTVLQRQRAQLPALEHRVL